MKLKEIKDYNKYLKSSGKSPNKRDFDIFNKYANEEEKLKREIEVLSYGNINSACLDTCMTYGLSGNCGEKCPKFKDGTCEYME